MADTAITQRDESRAWFIAAVVLVALAVMIYGLLITFAGPENISGLTAKPRSTDESGRVSVP